ncbi:MAG: hypothetical protein HKO93_07325, partial [Flavobacteriales bacterium]|nr:hypothetical protein [Flavobacteriales bacterium]
MIRFFDTSVVPSNKLFSRTRLLYVLLSIAGLAAVVIYFGYTHSDQNFHFSAHKIQKTIHTAEQSIQDELKEIVGLDAEQAFDFFNQKKQDLESRGLSYFMYKDEELVSWSSNSVPQASFIPELAKSGPCILLPNGWYQILKISEGGKEVFGAFLIKNEYLYENKYLVNEFHPCFKLSRSPEIVFTDVKGSHPIETSTGEVLFYIVDEKESEKSPLEGLYVLLMILVSSYFLVRYLFKALYTRSTSWWMLISAISLILLLRIITLWLGYPFGIDDSPIFDSLVYENSIVYPSLADLVINSYILLLCAFGFKEWLKRGDIKVSRPVVALLALVFFFFARALDVLFQDLIQGSAIGFNISNFFDLDFYSVCGIFSMSALLIAMLFLAQVIARLISEAGYSQRTKIIGSVVLGLIVIVINDFYGVVDMVKVLWPWGILVYLLLTKNIRVNGPRLVYVLGAIVLLSFYASHIFEKHVVKRDRQKLELIAERLMEGQDEVAEFLFEDMRERMENDSLLKEVASRDPFDEERMLSQLRQDYFNGYWSKYDIGFEIIDSLELEENKYEDIRDSVDMGFYRVTQSEIGLNYILKYELPYSKKLLVLFELNIIPEELGFPELLIEGGSVAGERLSRYSFAQYYKNELVDFYGDFDFRLTKPINEKEGSRYFEERGYWHFPFDRGEDTYIISTPRKTFIDRLTT